MMRALVPFTRVEPTGRPVDGSICAAFEFVVAPEQVSPVRSSESRRNGLLRSTAGLQYCELISVTRTFWKLYVVKNRVKLPSGTPKDIVAPLVRCVNWLM